MTPEEQKNYITNQRAKGTPDSQIYDTLQKSLSITKDRGFAGEILPSAFAIGGGILGGIGGAMFGGVGAVPGAIAGSAAGGAIGESIQQRIEKKFGQREKYDTPQIVGTGVISGLTEGAGQAMFKGGQLAVKVLRPKLVEWSAKISGYAPEVVEKALQRTPGAVEAMQKGEVALKDVVIRTAQGLSKFANTVRQESQNIIAKLSELSTGGPGYEGTRAGLLKESLKFVSKTVKILRENYNIGANKTGGLAFERPNLPSNIVSKSDQGAIQSAFSTIINITRNTTINQIDAVLERLMVLRSKTPGGSPTGAETRKIIGAMMDNVISFVKSIPEEYGANYAKYAQFLEENLPKRVMINDAKEIFGTSANLSPKEIALIEKRLLQLYNSGNLPIREFAEKIGSKVGEDITGTSAGTLLKTGDQISVRAPQLTKRQMLEKLVEVIPRKVISNYVRTGQITGDWLTNPTIINIAKITGKTVKAIINEVANLAANKSNQ